MARKNQNTFVEHARRVRSERTHRRVLAALALLTLVAKVFIERQLETESQELEAARAPGADTDPTTGGLGP